MHLSLDSLPALADALKTQSIWFRLAGLSSIDGTRILQVTGWVISLRIKVTDLKGQLQRSTQNQKLSPHVETEIITQVNS